MTNTTKPFIGHAAALKEIQESFLSKRMPHAWLISGIDGIGKGPLAKHIAHYILASGTSPIGFPDLTNPMTKLVEAETHPDLLFIRKEIDEKTGLPKNVIPVSSAQKVSPFLHKTSTHNGWRAVIIEDAHALNRHGQNAILKIVEEPPSQAVILITVTTPGLLLPTIRSRARALQLSPLGSNEMASLLQTASPQTPPEDLQTIISISGGSVGFAQKILRGDVLPLYREMLNILDTMPDMDIPRLYKLADAIAKKADAESFDVLSTLLVERLRHLTLSEAQKHPHGQPDIALALWEKTKNTLFAVDASNLDRKLSFINAMTDIKNA